MPIRILNSGVSLENEPNTYVVVVFRDEAGVVCRTTTGLPNRRVRRVSQQARRASQDGGGNGSGFEQRQTVLYGASGGNHAASGGGGGGSGDVAAGEPGLVSAAHDMTSVFGLEVHRIREDELRSEEHKRGSAGRKGSGKRKATHAAEGHKTRSATPKTPESATVAAPDGEESDKAEVWIERSAVAKSYPAHTALHDRVRQGNKLVKSVRAGRSLRKATSSSVKGALELGLWAANRPEDFLKQHLLQAMDETIARRMARRTSSSGQQGREGYRVDGPPSRVSVSGRSHNRDSVSTLGDGGGGVSSTNRSNAKRINGGVFPEGTGVRSPVAGGGTGAMNRGYNGVKINENGSGCVGSERGGPGGGGSECHPPGIKLTIPSADTRKNSEADRKLSTRGGGHSQHQTAATTMTSRSAPPTNGGRTPRGGSGVPVPMSARRAPPEAPLIISTAAKEELKHAVKAYVLRQRSLDDELRNKIRTRDFDWDADMRRMMDAVEVKAAGNGPRSHESVPTVMRKQVDQKKKMDEAKNIQGSWFPTMMRRTTPMNPPSNADNDASASMPRCMIRLAAGLYKIIVSGHMVSPSLFWSLVSATFQPDDHRDRQAQKMIFSCLSSVRQRAEDYHGFLIQRGIKIPRSLKSSFNKMHHKRSHPHKKGSSRSKSQIQANNIGKGHAGSDLDGDRAGGGDGGRRESSVIGDGGAGLRSGLMSAGASSDVSDDFSDSMSVLSFMSRETTHLSFMKVPATVNVPAK